MLTPFLFFAKFAVFSRFMPDFAGSMADICRIFVGAKGQMNSDVCIWGFWETNVRLLCDFLDTYGVFDWILGRKKRPKIFG